MDPAAASSYAVSLLSHYVRGRAAGSSAEPAVESLYQLIATRLWSSEPGRQAVNGFLAAPQDGSAQATLATAIKDEAARDWGFYSALAQAVGQGQPATGSPTGQAGYQQPPAGAAGPQQPLPGTATMPAAPAGWPAGQAAPAGPGRSRLTPRWIVAIVVAVVVLFVGIVTTVVVVASSSPYDEIAGTWVPDPAADPEAAGVLRITEDGEWTLEVVGLGGTITCSGDIEGDQASTYTLRADQGVCTTATARLEGEDVLVLTFPETPGEEDRLIRQ